MYASLLHVKLLRALKNLTILYGKCLKNAKTKLIIGYKKHSKVQSLFNGQNLKLNLYNFYFIYQHVKISRLTAWLELYFLNCSEELGSLALCEKPLKKWHQEFASPSWNYLTLPCLSLSILILNILILQNKF